MDKDTSKILVYSDSKKSRVVDNLLLDHVGLTYVLDLTVLVNLGGAVANCVIVTVPWFGGMGIGDKACQY